MLDGNEIWEILFSIYKGDVPEGMTEEVCNKLAEALNSVFSIKDK